MEGFDVVIVGGAAIGSAAAYFLGAAADFDGRVLVLEQDFAYQRCATTLSVASIRHWPRTLIAGSSPLFTSA